MEVISEIRPPYSTKEVAKLLRISEQTIRKEIRAGHFPGIKCGRKWLVPRGQLERYLQMGETNEQQ
jgi:excisionase family DNA binding protein